MLFLRNQLLLLYKLMNPLLNFINQASLKKIVGLKLITQLWLLAMVIVAKKLLNSTLLKIHMVLIGVNKVMLGSLFYQEKVFVESKNLPQW